MDSTVEQLITLLDLRYVLGIAGTVAFAVTAVLAVAPKGVDLFGVIVLGLITAVGGGTIRDVIIDVPVFWILDQTLLWVALGASLLTQFGAGVFTAASTHFAAHTDCHGARGGRSRIRHGA